MAEKRYFCISQNQAAVSKDPARYIAFVSTRFIALPYSKSKQLIAEVYFECRLSRQTSQSELLS